MKRTGNVEPLKSGRWSVRISFGDGTRERLGTFATEDEARRACQAALEEMGLDKDEERKRLIDLADDFLDGRELDGVRSIGDNRSTWRTWIATAKFYRRPLKSLDQREVRRWARDIASKRADQTARNALNLLRRACAFAIEEKAWIRANPCEGVTVPSKARTDYPWTYLTQSELPGRLVELATPHEWAVIAFAVGTGLRAGEQAALQLRDVHVDVADPFVTVRFGGIGTPTKTGQIRRVPLFGLALEATRWMLAELPRWCVDKDGRSLNERGLLFPTKRGNPRQVGRMLGRELRKGVYVDRWQALCERAGLFDLDADRPLVWHSLRHTCASWLVSGWWGRAWSLEEVRGMLGHSSITTTERYAHLGEGLLTRAARGTNGGAGSSLAAIRPAQALPREAEADRESAEKQAPPAGIGPATFGLGRQTQSDSDRALGTAVGQSVGNLRAAVLAGSDAQAYAAACELARVVLATPPVRLAMEVLAGGPHAIRAGLDLADLVDDSEQPIAARRRPGG